MHTQDWRKSVNYKIIGYWKPLISIIYYLSILLVSQPVDQVDGNDDAVSPSYILLVDKYTI